MKMCGGEKAQIATCKAVVKFLKAKQVVEFTETTMNEKFKTLWTLGMELVQSLEDFRDPE